MGSFSDAIALAAASGGVPQTSAVAPIHESRRLSFNLEQQITAELGVFAAPASPMATSSRTNSAISIAPRRRVSCLPENPGAGPTITVGLAGVINGISGVHQAYLNAGGLGILIGDGMLPHPAPEQIVEAYYQLPVSFLKADAGLPVHPQPGLQQRSRPGIRVAARMHAQF